MSVWWLTGQFYAGGRMYEYTHCLEGSFSVWSYRDIRRTIVFTIERINRLRYMERGDCERKGFGMTVSQYLKIRLMRRESSVGFREPDT